MRPENGVTDRQHTAFPGKPVMRSLSCRERLAPATALIWLLHLILCITLISGACAGGVVQSDALRWDDAEHVIHGASAGAFILCLALAIATGRAWRRIVWFAHGTPSAACFTAWCSVIAGIVFTAAVAITACVVIATPFDLLCAPFQ